MGEDFPFTTFSRHVLQCGPGIMDKHIENLLSIDHRLYLLSQEGNINQKSLSNESSYRSDGDNLFGTAQTGQSMPLYPMPTGTTTVGLNDSGALQGEHFQSSGKLQNWHFLKVYFCGISLTMHESYIS